MDMIKWIIILVLVLIVLSCVKGGIELLGQLIVSFFKLFKNTIGLFLFLLLIVALYFHGTNSKGKIYSKLSKAEIESYDPHFKCSVIIIDCEENLVTIKSLKDGKIYTHEQKMIDGLLVDIVNKYSRVILKNPKCEQFEVDTFHIGEIVFLDKYTYIDYKRDGEIFEYR
jgi:hypothetical protein